MKTDKKEMGADRVTAKLRKIRDRTNECGEELAQEDVRVVEGVREKGRWEDKRDEKGEPELEREEMGMTMKWQTFAMTRRQRMPPIDEWVPENRLDGIVGEVAKEKDTGTKEESGADRRQKEFGR